MRRDLRALVCPWVAMSAAVLLACGDERAIVEEPSPLAAPAAALGLATTSTCNAGQVAWDQAPATPEDQRVCAGPWRYQAYVSPCHAEQPSSACPVSGYEQKQCVHYETCRDSSFGVERFETQAWTREVAGHMTEDWECLPDGRCQYVTEYSYDNVWGCRGVADDVSHQLSYETGYFVYVDGFDGAITRQPGTSTRFTQVCHLTLYDVPIFFARAQAPCPVAYTEQCDDLTRPIYSACRHPNHGLDPDESACGLAHGGTTRVSAQGLSLSGLKAVDPTAAIDLNPSCTTCEALPMQTPADVDAKYACLAERVGALKLAGATEQLQTAGTQLRRLIEVAGHQLSEPYRTQALSFYREPGYPSDCGNPWTPPPAAPQCSSPPHSLALLQHVCQPLSLDHVAAPAARMFLTECLDFLDSASADPGCGLQPYAEPYRDVALTLLRKVLLSSSGPSGEARQNALIGNLRGLEQWRQSAMDRLYSSEDYRTVVPRFWEELSVLMSAFWKGAYDSELQLGGTLTPEVLDDLSAAYLKVEREVLLAAFDPATGVDSALLLPITSDALRGMVDRLRVASSSHDLGCRYLSCSGGSVSTEVSELWKLLSVLDDKGALTSALAASPHVRTEWRGVFQRIITQHASLDAAAADAFGTLDEHPAHLLRRRDPATLPQIAVGLAQLLREARERATSYEKHGLFDSGARNVLHTGMNSEQQSLINSDLDRVHNNLQQRISQYQATRTQVIDGLIQELRNKQAQDTGRARLISTLERLKFLGEDLAGLRHNLEVANARQGDFMKAFDALVATTDLQQLVVQATIPPLGVGAGHARYPGGSPSSTQPLFGMAVLAGAADPWKLSTLEGDFVTLEVSGQWSPTCAMQQSHMRLPYSGGLTAPITVTRAVDGPGGPQAQPVFTGPEGFLLQHQDSTFQAKSKQSVKESGTYEDYNKSEALCAGVNASLGTPGIVDLFAGASVEVYSNAEMCRSWDEGSRSSETDIDSDTDGEESRSIAAFTTGLRLAGTPFPQLPVGSLLLLEVAPPAPNTPATRAHIRNIHVLQTHYNAIAVDRASDLYLVVNDRTGCGPMPGGELTVRAVHTRPLGASLQQLGRAMAKVRTKLRASFPDYLRQGRLLAQDLASLRAQAFAQLATECACDVNDPQKIPMPFHGLFTAWLEHDLAVLQRQVEVRAVMREQALLRLELKALKDDFASAQAEARLVRMLPLWALRNLEGSQIESSTRPLVYALTQYLHPILHLRHPKVLSDLSAQGSATRTRLRALVDLDWTSPALEQAEAVLDVELDIRDAFAAAQATTHTLTPKFVALSFPRPGVPPRTPWRKVSDSRATQVWNHLLDTGIASFKVEPEDLYSALGGHAVLLCQEGAPVIRSMGLFVVVSGLDGEALNGLNTRLVARMDSHLAFATGAGLESYQQLNLEWLSGGTPVIYGGPLDAINRFQEKAQTDRAGNGLSPFTRFDVDGTILLQPYAPGEPPLIDMFTELVLVFQVEPRQLTQPMSWIRTCR